VSGCEKVEVAIRREKVEVASGRGGLGDLNAGQVPERGRSHYFSQFILLQFISCNHEGENHWGQYHSILWGGDQAMEHGSLDQNRL